MKKSPQWLLKVGLSFFSVLLCFLVLEIALRALLPEPENTLHTDRSKLYFKPQPKRAHPFVRAGEGNVGIGVIGDSFAQGAAIQEIDTFGRKLEYMLNLNETPSSVRVNNYARSGTSTFQQLKQLEQALNNNDDIVILQITLNDTEDWSDPKTIFEWRNKIIPAKPAEWMRPVINSSSLLAFAYIKYASLQSQKAFIHYYENIYSPDYSGWKRFVSALTIFKQRCEETNTSLVAVVFPLLSHTLDERAYPFKKMHQKIQEQLADNDIHFIDLYDTFKKMNHVRLEAIPGIDPHPNEIAHRIAAEEILEFIAAQKLIEEKYYPKIRKPGSHEHWQKTYEKMRLFLGASEDKK
jgi:hypothetical protein